MMLLLLSCFHCALVGVIWMVFRINRLYAYTLLIFFTFFPTFLFYRQPTINTFLYASIYSLFPSFTKAVNPHPSVLSVFSSYFSLSPCPSFLSLTPSLLPPSKSAIIMQVLFFLFIFCCFPCFFSTYFRFLAIALNSNEY